MTYKEGSIRNQNGVVQQFFGGEWITIATQTPKTKESNSEILSPKNIPVVIKIGELELKGTADRRRFLKGNKLGYNFQISPNQVARGGGNIFLKVKV